MRIITALILAASFLAWQPDASASPQSLDKLKKERQASKKQLRQTRQQIKANTRETERNLRAQGCASTSPASNGLSRPPISRLTP